MQEALQSPPSFPERIYVIASELHIGVPLKVYKKAVPRWKWVVLLILNVVMITSAILGIYRYNVDTRLAQEFQCPTCSPDVQQQIEQSNHDLIWQDINNIILGLTMPVVTLVVLGILIYNRDKRCFYLCSEGLFIAPKKRKLWFALRWDEINEIYWAGRRNVLLCRNRETVGFDLTDVAAYQEVVDAVLDKIAPRLLSQALTQYEQVGSVQFGCLSVDRTGITHNSPSLKWSKDERTVCWADLEDIRFEGGVLAIKTQKPWKRWDSRPMTKLLLKEQLWQDNLAVWKRWDSGPAVKQPKERALASLIPNPMIYAALVKELLSTELS